MSRTGQFIPQGLCFGFGAAVMQENIRAGLRCRQHQGAPNPARPPVISTAFSSRDIFTPC